MGTREIRKVTVKTQHERQKQCRTVRVKEQQTWGGEEQVETDKIFYLFIVDKPDKLYLSQKIKVNINSDVMLMVGTLDMM